MCTAIYIHAYSIAYFSLSSKLQTTIESVQESKFTTFEPGDPTTFGLFLDSVMGFNKTHALS